MKLQITQTLNRKIADDETVANLFRILSIAASLFVLMLSLWKLTRMELTESQLFFGVLLAPITPILLLVLGLLLPMAIAPKKG